MWVHIVIFMVILGAFLAGKLGRLPPWADNAEGQKLFVLVALAGNIIELDKVFAGCLLCLYHFQTVLSSCT